MGHLEICQWYIKNTEISNSADNNRCTPLHDSAHGGQLETFKCLLDNGADLYSTDELGNTLIHFGAYSGSYKMCKLVIDICKGGIDINTKNCMAMAPIHVAVEEDDYDLQIVRLLWKKGAEF